LGGLKLTDSTAYLYISQDGISLLHIASHKGYDELVEYFCSLRMDVDAQDCVIN